MRVNKKGLIKKGIAVGLIAAMAVVNPMQTLSPINAGAAPATAKAAEEGADPYIAEIRLEVNEHADVAIQKLEEAGYETIGQDLNEKAGSFWNDLGDQSVIMGIKRTSDEKKAIRDMKTMNMLGKYSYTGLKERIENNKQKAKETYEKLKTSLAEYSKNYAKKDLGAQTAHDLLNMYREDDSDKLLGDMFLKELDEEQIMKLLAEGNLHILANVFKSLSYAVETPDEKGNTWIERLSNVTSYNAVVKQYAKALYGTENVIGEQKAEVEAVVEADLNDVATTLLSNWGETRRIFTSSEDSEEVVEGYDGEFEDVLELLDVAESASNVEAVAFAKSYSYGKKTVYDYFTVSTATFEKNIKNLYPLAYALSEGQRGMLELTDMGTLVQAALIRNTDGSSEINDIVEAAQGTIDETEVVSVYAGVDRSIYDDDAAMTSQATANMSADARSQEEAENQKLWLKGCAIATAILFTLSAGCALASKVSSYMGSSAKSAMNKLFESTGRFAIVDYNTYNEFERKSISGEAYSSRFATLGKVLVVVSIVSAVVTAVQYYRTLHNEYNKKQLPIPEVLVDFDVEGSSGRNVVYHAVKWNRNRDDGRADRGDLNGDAAREWLALYTTKDEAMGDPILADSIITKVGDDGVPADVGNSEYAPLTMFGLKTVQNLVDSRYSYNDEVGGIYLWYMKGDASAADELIDDTEEEADEDVSAEADEETGDAADAASGAAAETTGSHISGGSIVLFVTAGAVGGFIIGVIFMYFIRRKKTVTK